MTDPPLFALATGRRVPGSRRNGLEADIRTARTADQPLAAAGVASLRRLAFELDRFEPVTAYDRMALAKLQGQFDDTYERCFGHGPAARDPLADALEAFRRSEASNPAGPIPNN